MGATTLENIIESAPWRLYLPKNTFFPTNLALQTWNLTILCGWQPRRGKIGEVCDTDVLTWCKGQLSHDDRSGSQDECLALLRLNQSNLNFGSDVLWWHGGASNRRAIGFSQKIINTEKKVPPCMARGNLQECRKTYYSAFYIQMVQEPRIHWNTDQEQSSVC